MVATQESRLQREMKGTFLRTYRGDWSGNFLQRLVCETTSDISWQLMCFLVGGTRKKLHSDRTLLVNFVTPPGPKHAYYGTCFFLSRQNKGMVNWLSYFAKALCELVCVCVCGAAGRCGSEPSWTYPTIGKVIWGFCVDFNNKIQHLE